MKEIQPFHHKRRTDWTVRWTEFMKDTLDLAPELKIDWQSEGLTCWSWACTGIETITGVNPHDEWVGAYTNQLGICKLLREHGFKNLDEYIAVLFPEIPVSMAQQGDLLLLPFARWNVDLQKMDAEPVTMMPHATALVDGTLYYGITEQGLVRGSVLIEGKRAFAVGREV